MNWDNAWKEVLTHLFREFLQFFFPRIYREVDFSRGYVFLDKELAKIIKTASVGGRIVDKLAKVYLKNGEEKWLLIHIEVQSYRDENFPERMFIYNYRIYDRYRREVISLALLADADENYRPNQFRIARWGFECKFRFPAIKLLDYRYKFEALRSQKNPFAMVLRGYLKTLETIGNDRERFSWKKRFLMELYRSGMNRETILGVYKFIDWVMELPEELEERILDETHETEEEKTMSVLTTAEKRGHKKGLEQGLEQGIREGIYPAIADLLEIKFSVPGLALMDEVKQVSDIGMLNKIRLAFKNAATLAEAQDALKKLLSDKKE